ncbi:hypothetical protein TNCV_2103531 [Trichonephila clavipes]|nr:hypothetical protein TNCV_2103531 [Trichonephila clavipes]
MPPDRQCQIETHEIHHGKWLVCTPVVDHSFKHHAGDSTILALFHSNLEGEHSGGGQRPPTSLLTMGLAARRLFRVPPCHEGTFIYKHPCLL